MEPKSTACSLVRTVRSGSQSQYGGRRTLFTLPLPLYTTPKSTRIRWESRRNPCTRLGDGSSPRLPSSSSSPSRNRDSTPNVPKASLSCTAAKFFKGQRHREGTTPQPQPHCSRRIITDANEVGTQQTTSVDNDEEIVVIRDKGKNRLFPNEPEMSFEFKEYLLHLNKQAPDKVMKLKQKPPVLLDKLEKSSDRPKNTSYCFITLEDLDKVHKEIDKIVAGWSMGEKQELITNMDSSIQLLSLQNYLTNHILAAKKTCIQNDLRKLQMEMNTDSFSLVSVDRKTKLSKMDEVGCSLFWQAGIFRDMYRQTLLTPFMLEKKQRYLPFSLLKNMKRASAAANSGTFQKKSKNSQKNAPTSAANSNQINSGEPERTTRILHN